jgi:hypothetical protein
MLKTTAVDRRSRPRFLGALLACVLSLALARAPAVRANDSIAPDLIRKVELQWEEQEDAVEYQIQLSTDPQFLSTLYDETLKDLSFAVRLLPGAYYYRVRATDKRGRPSAWTAVQELNINARPPKLLYPEDKSVVTGNLPDTGLELEWRTSGPGIKYLIEIVAADPITGQFTETVARQEVASTTFPFFPQNPGLYRWSVHTLGAGGDEPGVAWTFSIEGVVPPGSRDGKKIVRYVAPWWRKHWTLMTRYGQFQTAYNITDLEFGANSNFSGLGGYLTETLHWEWHDPAEWTFGGVPWAEGEWELDRLTVLEESVLLQQRTLRGGAWYQFNSPKMELWRFSPVFEFALDDVALYQARSEFEAVRSISQRNHIGLGLRTEYKLKPFLTLGALVQGNYEFGGVGGLATINGDQFDLNTRVGSLQPSGSFVGELNGTLALGPRLLLQGRLRYQTETESWTPRFIAPLPNGVPPLSNDGLSSVSITNLAVDVTFGFKFSAGGRGCGG